MFLGRLFWDQVLPFREVQKLPSILSQSLVLWTSENIRVCVTSFTMGRFEEYPQNRISYFFKPERVTPLSFLGHWGSDHEKLRVVLNTTYLIMTPIESPQHSFVWATYLIFLPGYCGRNSGVHQTSHLLSHISQPHLQLVEAMLLVLANGLWVKMQCFTPRLKHRKAGMRPLQSSLFLSQLIF